MIIIIKIIIFKLILTILILKITTINKKEKAIIIILRLIAAL